MGCCSNCARKLIGIVSICVIICAVVAGIVVYTKEKGKDWSKLISNNIPFIFILVVMCAAVITSIIGFILCCCHARCLYITYLIIIGVAIVLELIAIIIAFTFKDKILDGIEKNWQDNKFNETRISIEKQSRCCGFKTNLSEGIECGYPNHDENTPLCYDKINKELNSNMKSLRIAVIIILIVQTVLLICAIYLTVSSRDRASSG